MSNMKEKASATKNSRETRKKRKISENSDNAINLICERRRQELSEIITEENRLHSGLSEYGNISQQTTSEDNENDNDCTDLDLINFQLFLAKEQHRTVEKFQIINRSKAKSALDKLKGDTKQLKNKLTNEEKRLNILKKHCSKTDLNYGILRDHTWHSSMYIVKNIRACILTRDWNNLTHYLLMLFKYRRAYVPYIKQVALLNFLCNPEDNNGTILEEFFELCTLPKSTEV